MSSYKRLSGMENYGSINSAQSQLLEISSEVELEDDGEEELEFKKPKVSAMTVLRYCGAATCLVTMVIACKLFVYMCTDYIIYAIVSK